MTKWEVKGADRNTGSDVKVEIDAPDEAAARRQAHSQNVLVSTVEKVEEGPVLDYSDGTEPQRPALSRILSERGGRRARDGRGRSVHDFVAQALGMIVLIVLYGGGGLLALSGVFGDRVDLVAGMLVLIFGTLLRINSNLERRR